MVHNMYKVLDKINFPEDLKALSFQERVELCSEIRSFLIESVSKTGGHLASNLGVVEITVALHSVFNTPEDKILMWDISAIRIKSLQEEKISFPPCVRKMDFRASQRQARVNMTALIRDIAPHLFRQHSVLPVQGIWQRKVIK